MSCSFVGVKAGPRDIMACVAVASLSCGSLLISRHSCLFSSYDIGSTFFSCSGSHFFLGGTPKLFYLLSADSQLASRYIGCLFGCATLLPVRARLCLLSLVLLLVASAAVSGAEGFAAAAAVSGALSCSTVPTS
jgi:hypothetical protein